MLPLHTELVALEHRKQRLRESEEDRLIRLAKPVTKRPALSRRLVAIAGACMVSLGAKMLAYSAVSTAKLHRPEALSVLSYGYQSGCSFRSHLGPVRSVDARAVNINGTVTVWSRR